MGHKMKIGKLIAGSLATLLLMSSLLSTTNVPVAAQSAAPDWWRPNVAIIYPDGGLNNLAQSTQVNISVWPSQAVPCDQQPARFDLWVAKDNEPVHLLATSDQAQFTLRRDGDHYFPTLEFNNVPADVRNSQTSQYRFFAGGNVWVHAVDARTYYPNPVVPVGFAEGVPGRAVNLQQIDARIQIVYPHDAQGHLAPVSQARYVNVAVELFEHGTLKAVQDFPASLIVLYAAKGNDPRQAAVPVALGAGLSTLTPPERITYKVGDQEYPRWVFNNIPVEPGQQYNFSVSLGDPNRGAGGPTPDSPPFTTYSSIWTHATDARTYLPSPQPPKYDNPTVLHCTP